MNKFIRNYNEAKKDADLFGAEDDVKDDDVKDDDVKDDEKKEEEPTIKLKDVKDFLKTATRKNLEACAKVIDTALEDSDDDSELDDEAGDDKKEPAGGELEENAFDRILKKYGIDS